MRRPTYTLSCYVPLRRRRNAEEQNEKVGLQIGKRAPRPSNVMMTAHRTRIGEPRRDEEDYPSFVVTLRGSS